MTRIKIRSIRDAFVDWDRISKLNHVQSFLLYFFFLAVVVEPKSSHKLAFLFDSAPGVLLRVGIPFFENQRVAFGDVEISES